MKEIHHDLIERPTKSCKNCNSKNSCKNSWIRGSNQDRYADMALRQWNQHINTYNPQVQYGKSQLDAKIIMQQCDFFQTLYSQIVAYLRIQGPVKTHSVT